MQKPNIRGIILELPILIILLLKTFRLLVKEILNARQKTQAKLFNE